ncbi:hypothetical protein HK101_001601, partial [Irineochytrium annulatum]
MRAQTQTQLSYLDPDLYRISAYSQDEDPDEGEVDEDQERLLRALNAVPAGVPASADTADGARFVNCNANSRSNAVVWKSLPLPGPGFKNLIRDLEANSIMSQAVGHAKIAALDWMNEGRSKEEPAMTPNANCFTIDFLLGNKSKKVVEVPMVVDSPAP